jgi:leucyl/phenylalanyl-tRNA--protein transferase
MNAEAAALRPPGVNDTVRTEGQRPGPLPAAPIFPSRARRGVKYASMAASPPSVRSLAESLADAPYPLRQAILGSAYRLVPRRLPGLLPLLAVTFRDLPRIGRPILPDPAQALDDPDGLCSLAGAIGVEGLMEGYRRGAFVMSHIGPLKWWASRHRMVLFFDEARVEKTVRRLLRSGRFRFTIDTAFAEVMQACAAPRPGGTPLTWITPRIRSHFLAAHRAGHAHSLEVWQDDRLVGGMYGLAVGRVLFTESQFHTARDASKVGFAVLNRHLQTWGFALNDGKHATRYLTDCGMVPVTRDEFSDLTERFSEAPTAAGLWQLDPALLDDRWEPAKAVGLRAEEVLPGGSGCGVTAAELLTSKRSATW